jgi:hypothetical protein
VKGSDAVEGVGGKPFAGVPGPALVFEAEGGFLESPGWFWGGGGDGAGGAFGWRKRSWS